MKITSNNSLTEFDFWSGATDHEFTYSELREFDDILEDLFPDGATETQINDLFWFEEEYLCECLGIDYNEYLNR
jgi:hypothetical protein